MLELLLAVALATAPAMKAPKVPPPSFTSPSIAVPAAAEEEDAAPTAPGSYSYQFSQPQRVEIADGRTRVATEQGLGGPRGGYAPLRISIDNTSGPRQVVSLIFRGYGSRSPVVVTRQVEVPEGANQALTLAIPASVRNGTLEAKAPGIAKGGPHSVYWQNIYGNGRAILSVGKAEQFQGYLDIAPDYSSAEHHVAAYPPEQVPSELASLMGFDAVVLPEPGLVERLSEAQRRALEQYAVTGGTLILPRGVREQSWLPLLSAAGAKTERYGLGRVLQASGPQARDALRTVDDELPVSPEGPPPAWERRYGGRSWDALLPQATAPVGLFLLIMTAFTLLIGPGSVLVARRRGPSALLVTIPVTAFFTCAAIIGFSLAADGFTIHAGAWGYTLLDSKQHRAVTAGLGAYYANLAPREVRFGAGQVPFSAWKGNGEQVAVGLEWKDGARFGADFLPSRSYREWGFVAVEPTRARLVVKPDGDGFRVQNALGGHVDVVQVQVAGKVWQARDVKDGGEAKLEVHGQTGLTLGSRFRERFPTFVTEPFTSELSEGQFLAQVDGPAFVPMGGLSVTHHESQSLVLGEVER